jgi:hypothetical protein
MAFMTAHENKYYRNTDITRLQKKGNGKDLISNLSYFGYSKL